MIDKVKKTLQQASEAIKEQASTISDSALERTYKLFEQWTAILPTLEKYGFEIQNFGISLTLSPSMEIGLLGNSSDFNSERLKALLEEHSDSTILTSIFRTIKTTYDLHTKSGAPLLRNLHLKLLVKIPPEIKVVIGDPSLL